jgi:non-SMC mitotic condensation complex subunit 1, N-term
MSGFATEVDAATHDIHHEDQQTCAAHKIPMEMYAFLLNWSARSVEKVKVPDEDASAAMVPTKSRKGRGGKATQSRVASKNKAAEWSWKDQIVPISHADRQGFEVEDVQDLDCERGAGYFYRVRRLLSRTLYESGRHQRIDPYCLGRHPRTPPVSRRYHLSLTWHHVRQLTRHLPSCKV